MSDLLGHADVASAHATTVAATPEQAIVALQEVRGSDLPVTRALMGIRTLGRRRSGSDAPVLKGLARLGGGRLSVAPARLEYGLIAQPWRIRSGESIAFGDAAGFTAFERPGFVKVQVDFWADPAPGGSRLQTATRIRATDPASLRRFKRYWRVVGPGSGLIRREWLRAARRRAEA